MESFRWTGIKRLLALCLGTVLLLTGCGQEEGMAAPSVEETLPDRRQEETEAEHHPQTIVEFPVTLLPVRPGERRSLTLSAGNVQIKEEQTEDTPAVVAYRRMYTIFQKDRVLMGRSAAKTQLEDHCTAEFFLPGREGMLRYYDAASKQWQEGPLQDARVQAGCVVATMDGGGEYMLYTPRTYADQGAGTLRYFPESKGALEVLEANGGYTLRLLTGTVPAGCLADWTAVYSPEGLLDWDSPTIRAYWDGYTLDGDGKWCYDGYYWPSPDNYVPSGENHLYRCPAAYLCKSFAYGAERVRAAEDLAIATLDVMALQQNKAGYVPTLPQSGWLKEAYGFGGGFYDTRFNTDLAEIYYRFGQHLRCEEFDQAVGRYFDFFLTFAESHHRETESGGWLVDDYGHPEGGKRTHTSLNHQLAEILTLYHHGEALERPELTELADKMLQGVVDTAENWIREDQNLHYACLADGTYGDQDYPYLTYNDLFALKEYLAAQGRDVPELTVLMDAKRAWMVDHDVTGYAK